MEWHKMHQPAVITAYDRYIMNKHDEWRRVEAAKQGFLPLHKMQDAYVKATFKFVHKKNKILGREMEYTEVITIDPPEGVREPTKEEWAAYNRAQSEWIAEEILRDWDWARFVKYCKDNKIKEFIASHKPCDGKDAQCNMDCEYLINGRCPKP